MAARPFVSCLPHCLAAEFRVVRELDEPIEKKGAGDTTDHDARDGAAVETIAPAVGVAGVQDWL